MGLFDWLKSSGPIESAATGAVIGAVVGDRVANAEQLAEIAGLLKAQIAQQQLYRAQDHLDLLAAALERPDKYKNWRWTWLHTSERPWTFLDFTSRLYSDPKVREIYERLSDRWEDLAARAWSIGMVPTVYMPRSQTGDVVGTPAILTMAMDKLEKLILKREAAL